MRTLDAFAREKLSNLQARGLRRDLRPTRRLGGGRVVRGGRELISFACNDYLDLACHPRVVAAGQAALQIYGAGSGGSRLVTGDTPEIGALEEALARKKGAEAAVVFGSGYLANIGIVPALAGSRDLILVDELSHACMWAGARLSGASVEPFRHNDLNHLSERLAARRAEARHTMILTERVFSMDGDRAPLAELLALADGYDAWTLVDDAHGFGIVEPGRSAPLEMGTLSKALGSYGGYLCGSRSVVELLHNRARSFVYTTGLPPACAASAREALAVIEAEPERSARVLALAGRLTQRLGLPEAQSAIVPYMVGEPQAAMAMSAALEARGFLVVPIRPPTVPPGTARLRIALSAAHTDIELDALADALNELRPMKAA